MSSYNARIVYTNIRTYILQSPFIKFIFDQFRDIQIAITEDICFLYLYSTNKG